MASQRIDPREMAAAPLTRNTDGTPKTDEHVNRFDSIFTGMVFKAASATAKTYEEGDRKTRKIANVLIEIANSGTFLKGSVKAIQDKGDNKPHAEFGFFGAVNQGTCIVTDEPQAGEDLEAFRRTVVKQYGAWRQKHSVSGTKAPQEALVLDDLSL